MSLRTTPERVKAILQANYDTRRAPPLGPYITPANILTTRLVAEASRQGVSSYLDSATLAEIETWLAGYYYTKMDPLYLSKSTDGSGGSFQRGTKNDYLTTAIELDPTGLLSSLIEPGQRAEAGWMGKTETERVDYDQRN